MGDSTAEHGTDETVYLLRNQANAERLLASIDRARRGEFDQNDLIDAESSRTAGLLGET